MSGAGAPGACFRQRPFAASVSNRAALFHRLKRIGKRPAARFRPRHTYLFGELGQRKRSIAAKDVSYSGADGLWRLRRGVRLRFSFRVCLRFSPWGRRGVERIEFALGNTRINARRA